MNTARGGLGYAVLVAGAMLVWTWWSAVAGPPVLGSGMLVATTRPVAGISEVVLAGGGTLLVEQGPAEMLTIEAEETILPYLKADIDGPRLALYEEHRAGRLQPTRPVTYRLTVRTLSALNLSGSGSAVASAIATDRLTVSLTGAGNLRLVGLRVGELGALLSGAGSLTGAGTARQQTVTITGAGDYLGDALEAQTASVTLTGAGDARVRVSDRLALDVTGPGEISVIGSPIVTRRVTGPLRAE
ncbi:MAG: DUF2807 domain-containing protein [Chloroflexi bacterium]|nr:DUF2807 domain-containing protein [Chloroflexota bacterium]